METCLYNTLTHQVYTFIIKGKAIYSKRAPYLIMKERPELIVCSWGYAQKAIESHFITPFQETTKERFFEMLEVLPPINWRFLEQVEMFQVSEMTISNITATFARINDKYYEASKPTSIKLKDVTDELIK